MKRTKGRWFLPESADVIAMLVEQADVTVRGMEAFARWGGGEEAAGLVVREAEHEADACKLALIAAVRESFTTALDPEDLFELSSGLDDVMNGAKNTVREAEALSTAPDQPMAGMCDELTEGVRRLRDAFAALGHDPVEASAQAAAATKAQRRLEHIYRAAMSTLIEQDDIHVVVRHQELYRRLDRISDDVISVAERVVYATVKEG